MGRRKIQIKPIKEDRNRYVTFIKRKAGLFKKAHELAVLCQVELALVVVTQEGKVFEYSTAPNAIDIFHKRQSLPLAEHKRPSDYGHQESGAEDDEYEDDDELNEHDGKSRRVSDQSGTKSNSPPSAAAGLRQHQQQYSQHQQQQGHQQGQSQHKHSLSLPGGFIDRPTSRPRLKVQIPMAPPEEPKSGPGPLTALAASGVDTSIDPTAAQRQEQASGPSSRQDTASLNETASSASSSQHAQNMQMLPGQGISPTTANAAMGLKIGTQGMVPPGSYLDSRGQHQNQSQNQGQNQQPMAPYQFAAQRSGGGGGVQMSPGVPSSSTNSSFQPPYQNFYGHGFPMSYNYNAKYGPPSAGPVPPRPLPGNNSNASSSSALGGGSTLPPGMSSGAPPSAGGRWSGHPQSPMTYFVPTSADQQKLEPGPLSAAIPSRYMNEMLSPSNYFSMEWGVWDPQASAVPGGTARVVPPPSAHPTSENNNTNSGSISSSSSSSNSNNSSSGTNASGISGGGGTGTGPGINSGSISSSDSNSKRPPSSSYSTVKLEDPASGTGKVDSADYTSAETKRRKT